MGSFNVGCGVSGLTIHEDDETGFIIITDKPTYPTPGKKAPNTRTMHIYSTDLYEPYLPPVYGVYDDYGNLADLKTSPTTEALEAIFKRPALDVINAIGQDRGLYSTFGTIAPLYLDPAVLETIGSYESTDEEKFVSLGFTPHTAQGSNVAAYRYGEYELVATLSSTSGQDRLDWALLRHTTNEIIVPQILSHYGLEGVFSTFALETGFYPGFARDEWAAVKELQRLHGMFFLKDAYVNCVDAILEDDWDSDHIDNFENDFTQAMKDLEDGDKYSSSFYDLQRTVGMRGATWQALKPLVGTGEYSEIARFLRVLTATNRMLMPSLNGEQHGNDAASMLLAQACVEILVKRKARWYNEDED